MKRHAQCRDAGCVAARLSGQPYDDGDVKAQSYPGARQEGTTGLASCDFERHAEVVQY